jgi:hypothetical protein
VRCAPRRAARAWLRTLAKKRLMVDSETNKYFAIAAFGLFASIMSAISSHLIVKVKACVA